MKAVVVVPTIRGENLRSFLDQWGPQFRGHTVIVVEDNPEPTFDVNVPDARHYSWRDIDAELGTDAWIIPRRTDCVRSYGYLKAYQEAPDMVVTLDDDCYPCGPGFLEAHYQRLTRKAVSPAWVSTGRGVLPRGMPYYGASREVDCVINHGLWTRVPDFDAVSQLASGRYDLRFEPMEQVVPRGQYFPMCGMNLAFKPEVIPALYFLLMGQPQWPYDRFGDIWCGVLIKRICDHLGLGVHSGEPLIEHQRASNVWANLRKEGPGYEVNESFWQAVDSVLLGQCNFRDCYREMAAGLPLRGDYWDRLRQAMRVWADLY